MTQKYTWKLRLLTAAITELQLVQQVLSALQSPGIVALNSLSPNFLIIIDLSNQLCEAQKVQEKHNKLNCVDYDAGIVQTLLLTCSRNFSISPLLTVSGFCCGWWPGDVGTLGDATWGSWAQDYRGNATSNYFLTLSRLGARRNLYIAHHTLSAHCEPEENRGNVTPWSDLIWINSRTQTIHLLNSWETLTCRGGASHKVVTNVSRRRCHRCPAWLYDDQGQFSFDTRPSGSCYCKY